MENTKLSIQSFGLDYFPTNENPLEMEDAYFESQRQFSLGEKVTLALPPHKTFKATVTGCISIRGGWRTFFDSH